MIIKFRNLYEKSPNFLRQCVRLVPFHYRMGSTYRQTLKFLKDSDKWSRQQYREYQRRKLTLLLETTIKYVPHYQQYRKLLARDPFTILAEIEPVTKAQIQADIERFLLPPNIRGKFHLTYTGGSSGVPLTIYLDNKAPEREWAFIIAAWMRAGYKPGAPRVSIRGMPFSQDSKEFISENPVYNETCLSPFYLSDQHLRQYVDLIRKKQPRFIRGYPSVLMVLARYLEDKQINDLPPVKALLCGSEILDETQREFLQRVFHSRIYSWYGMSEKVILAAECEFSTAYHVFPQYGITEIMDSRGNISQRPGVSGEIVGTGFLNRVMPFIRYRTEDYSTIINERCESCGREHMLLSEVRSHRIGDVLVGRSGTLVSMTALNIHDDTFAGVRQFQFHQKQPGKVTLYLSAKPGFDSEKRKLILRSLKGRTGDEIDYSIKMVDSIKRTGVGKGVYLKQELPCHITQLQKE